MLESILENDAKGCPEWLWSHGKWKIHARVESRYQLLNKRKQLIEISRPYRGEQIFLSECPIGLGMWL